MIPACMGSTLPGTEAAYMSNASGRKHCFKKGVLAYYTELKCMGHRKYLVFMALLLDAEG